MEASASPPAWLLDIFDPSSSNAFADRRKRLTSDGHSPPCEAHRARSTFRRPRIGVGLLRTVPAAMSRCPLPAPSTDIPRRRVMPKYVARSLSLGLHQPISSVELMMGPMRIALAQQMLLLMMHRSEMLLLRLRVVGCGVGDLMWSQTSLQLQLPLPIPLLPPLAFALSAALPSRGHAVVDWGCGTDPSGVMVMETARIFRIVVMIVIMVISQLVLLVFVVHVDCGVDEKLQ